MIALFDTHAHLQAPDFDRDRAAVLSRARQAGVSEIVVIGEDEAAGGAALALAETDERLWAAVGVHPHVARAAGPDLEVWLALLAQHPKAVAIGEIGLDFHYDRSPRPTQVEVFRAQLRVAAALDLPVVIHSREAERETLTILEAWSGERRAAGAVEPLGVMHCFGYGVAAAERCVALGFMVSIPGTVTFPRADVVRSVARAVPAAALVIETDAPVLAPQAHRGRRNEPAYLVETARAVAALRGVSLAELAESTRANARRLFRLGAPSAAPAPVENMRA